MTSPGTPTATPDAGPARRPRRVQPRHAGYLVLVAIVVVAIYALFQLAAGDDATTTTETNAIEQLIPTADAKILQQDQIGIDLAPGYEGSLAVNGTPLPDDEVLAVPQLNQVFFQPGPGKTIEQWPAGRNCIIATFWRSATGPGQSTNRAWCFTVV